MNLSAVRRLTIQAKTEGFPQATSDLNRLSDAQASVATTGQTMATVTDVATRKQLSAAQAYQRQTLALDEQARMQDRLAKQMKVADQALQQGLITQQQYAERLQLIKASLSTPANDNFARSTRQNTEALKNFGYQANDVVQGLLTGQRPFQILLQQGGQIQQAFGQHSGGAAGVMREFTASIVSFFTPARLAATAVLAIGAAVTAAALSWKSFALTLDDTAKQAGITSSEMAKLQAVAGFKGIGQDDFAKAMGQFSQSVYEARNNMGGLAEVLRTNGLAAVRGFSDGFDKVADLVARARGDTEKQFAFLRQAGLPATMEWVRLMEQSSVGLQKAKAEAVAFGGAANDNMVAKAREYEELINKITTNIGLYWKNFGLGAINTLETIFTGLTNRISSFLENPIVQKFTSVVSLAYMVGKHVGEFVAPSSSPSLATGGALSANPGAGGLSSGAGIRSNAPGTIDPNILKDQISKYQQLIGILGQLATVEQQVASKRKELELAGLNGVGVTTAQRDAILALARAQADGTLQMRAQADSMQIEAATVSMSVGAATAYRIEQEKIAEAKRIGLQVSEQTHEAWKREAAAAGEAAQALERARIAVQIKFDRDTLFLSPENVQIAQQLRGLYGNDVPKALASSEAAAMRFNNNLKFTLDIVRDIGREIFSSVVRGLIEGKNVGEALEKTLQNLSMRLADKAIEQLLSGEWEKAAVSAISAAVTFIGSKLFNTDEAKKLKEAEDAWYAMSGKMKEFIDLSKGFDLAPIVQQLRQLQSSAEELWVAATKAKDAKAAADVITAWRDSIVNAVNKFANPQIGMSDAAKQIADLQQNSQQLAAELMRINPAFAGLIDQMKVGVEQQIATIRKAANDNFVSSINSATGRSYINDLTTLFDKIAQARREGLVSSDLIDRDLVAEAQSIINSAGLVGDSFDELLRIFPNLTGKVNESADALQKAADAQEQYQESLNQSARSIVDYLNNLNAGSESTLSPVQRLYAAQSAYQSTLSLAQQNNQQALGRITTDADNWLNAARAVFASGAGYQSILQQIQSQLAGLPAVQTSTDPVVQALLNVQGVMQNVLTGVNNVNAGVGGVASGVNSVRLSVDSTTGMVTATRDAVNGTTGAIGGTTSAVNENKNSTYNIVDEAVDRLNVAIERFSSAVSLLSQTVNALNDSVALLDAIRGLQDTSKQQLQILASQNRASSFTTSQWNGFGVGVGGRFDPVTTSTSNSMLEALNKIAFNTYATSLNTANLAAVGTSSANRVLIGTFETGGTLGAGGFGIFGEHHPDGPWLMKAGANPVPITPALPTFASNDNSAMVAELRALRAEVANLQRVVAASGNQVTRAVVAASDENVAVTEDAGKRMAFEVARTSRDNKAA